MTVQQYYDRYWSQEGFAAGFVRPIARNLRATLCEQVTAETECLDVGCGDGRAIGLWLSRRARRYLGVDISGPAIAEARSLGLEALQIDDARELPFDDGSFDCVVCLEVLEHLFEPHLAAMEAHRVLRPSGTYVVSVPNVAYWRWRRDLSLRGEWNPFGDDESVDAPWRDPHIRFFTADALVRMLERAGFPAPRVGGHEGEIGAARVLAGVARRHAPTRRRLHRALERKLLRTLSLRLHAVGTKPA